MPTQTWRLAPPFIYANMCFTMIAGVVALMYYVVGVTARSIDLGENPPKDMQCIVIVISVLILLVSVAAFIINLKRLLCRDCTRKGEDDCRHHKKTLIWFMAAQFALYFGAVVVWCIIETRWVV